MSDENMVSAKEENTEKRCVVGIGASAGGLEALQNLLSALPPNLGFPYVVIQHLSPDYKSLLSEILSKTTAMPVIQVEDGMEAQPDCVYVIPPGKSMYLSGNTLFLREQKSGALHLPVDTFFRSLAEEAGPNAIAIILSGTGSDGTNGIKSIKENDGMIIVQSPESSKFDGMPKSAIRTGLVDAQCSPEEIALELEHISAAAQKGAFPPKTEKQIDEELMERIYYILKKVSNVNFTHYKQATVLRRVERRMMLAHKDSLAEYVDYLYEAPEEAKVLSKEVLIGVTNFFREPEYFDILQEKAIKNIILHSSASETVRVWIAGCSTGEEAYSIAILFCETMETLKIKREVKIFATDLDAEAVTTAGKGVYGNSISSSVSAARLSRYFTRRNNTYVINRDIRKMLVFSPHNVIQDPPFGKLDLISCRNLMIYFQPVLQKDLFAIFHAALKDGGYLFLGKSEAVGSYTEVFPVVDAAAKIFTHRSNIKIKGSKAIPYLQTAIMEDSGSGTEEINLVKKSALAVSASNNNNAEQTAINTALLERFMPACLVINEKNDLVYVYGDSKNYIAFPVGKITNALFDVIAEPLRIPVSTALKEAREKQKMVQYKDICFVGEHKECVISLTATPISKQKTGIDSLYALVFTEIKNQAEMPDAIPYEIDHMAAQRITDLEQELSKVQDRLNRSVTEQECVNEELQASNEELLTANEELQSSNEELQSVNEELYTVNSEYQVKLTELADMNDDITNFLATTLIGIIFVDGKLSLRRFTNYVTTEFNIMDQDIGRSIDFISYHFPSLNMAAICNNVIETLVPDEREVVSNRGKTFFMRVAPFRTTENKILGCVITMVDITDQKQEQIRLQNTEVQLSLAKQANEAKSDFLTRMSHEIRTPMNALAGISELLQQQLDDKEALVESARQISETVKYMTAIVSDILEMSKIERSQVELVSEPLVINDVINRVMAIIKPRVADCGLLMDIAVADNFAPVYIGDAARIQQILINFLTNALKFTPSGGTVGFKVSQESLEDGRATICFVIADTGIGISKEFIPELFKPFVRENKDGRNTSSSSSMGLGLAIAYNIIKLMDGDVTVDSGEGKGTTFTIHIKLDTIDPGQDSDEMQKLLAEVNQYSLVGCNVLVAEDNDVNRIILESLLAQQGITFVSACDGEDAVKLFTSSPENTFDCILMDVRMPKLDGLQAAQQIRNSDRADARTVPIIAVSANAFMEDLSAARKAGINEYITKPINTKKLFMVLDKYWKVSEKVLLSK